MQDEKQFQYKEGIRKCNSRKTSSTAKYSVTFFKNTLLTCYSTWADSWGHLHLSVTSLAFIALVIKNISIYNNILVRGHTHKGLFMM